jgi:integrase
MLSFMIHCGLRVGELVQLTLDMVLLERRPLEMVNLDASITKTNIARAVPMPIIVKGALTQYIKDDYHWYSCPENFVFPSGIGSVNHITVRRVQQLLSKISKVAIGLEISPHVLRHTFATRMMKLTDIPTLQRLMGHKSIKSTQVYTHPSNQDMLDASKKLDALNQGL